MKECPFCGSTEISEGEVLGKVPNSTGYFMQAGCMGCGALGPQTFLPFMPPTEELKAANVRAWDTRAPLGDVLDPIPDCSHHNEVDRLCNHPKNITPECHINCCPRLNPEVRELIYPDD